jgi:hypothetical protein
MDRATQWTAAALPLIPPSVAPAPIVQVADKAAQATDAGPQSAYPAPIVHLADAG